MLQPIIVKDKHSSLIIQAFNDKEKYCKTVALA
jgi:hypothetical protein